MTETLPVPPALWQTDRDGVLVGPATPDLSPLDHQQGRVVWLIPAGCVDVAPPVPDDGELVRWADGAWIIEPLPAPPDVPDVQPEPAIPADASGKLAAFLRANPDVLALLEG